MRLTRPKKFFERLTSGCFAFSLSLRYLLLGLSNPVKVIGDGFFGVRGDLLSKEVFLCVVFHEGIRREGYSPYLMSKIMNYF